MSELCYWTYIRLSSFIFCPFYVMWYDAWRLVKHHIGNISTTYHLYNIIHIVILHVIIKQVSHSSLFVIHNHHSLHHSSLSFNNHNIIIYHHRARITSHHKASLYNDNLSSSTNILYEHIYIFHSLVNQYYI